MQFESVALDSVLGWHQSSAFETSSRVMPGLLDHRPHFQYQHFCWPTGGLLVTVVGFLGKRIFSESFSRASCKRLMASGSEHIVLWVRRVLSQALFPFILTVVLRGKLAPFSQLGNQFLTSPCFMLFLWFLAAPITPAPCAFHSPVDSAQWGCTGEDGCVCPHVYACIKIKGLSTAGAHGPMPSHLGHPDREWHFSPLKSLPQTMTSPCID